MRIHAKMKFHSALRRGFFARSALALCVLLALGAMSSLCAAQEGSRLEKIEVDGHLKKLTPEQVIASSGLQLGQTVDRQILQAVTDKMMKSKLYSSAGYHLSTADDKATVTLLVEEADRPAPKPTPEATPKTTRPRTTRRRPTQ